MDDLRKMFGVSADTIRRWMTVFWERLPRSNEWLRTRGRLVATVRDEDVPAGLLDHLFAHDNDIGRVMVRACRLVPGL